MADVKVTRARKAARDAVDDVDYLDKLGPEESAFMERFLRATGANSVQDMEALVQGDPEKLAALKKQMFAEDNARRRDIMHVGARIDFDPLDSADALDGEIALRLGDVSEADLPHMRCPRCCNTEEHCRCPREGRQRYPKYGQADYLPQEFTEERLLSELDLKRRMAAFDLLPYGDCPSDLKQGHTVKICLPHHLLNGAWGYVLDFRPMTGEYLVRSMSKQGLRDKDGTPPIATVCWVRPAGLKRWSPRILKGATQETRNRVDTY